MDNDFKRDEDGNIVLSKLNEGMLRDIAAKGQGKYYLLGSGNDEVDALLNQLKGISSKQFEEMVFTDFDDYFQYCIAIAIVLLLIEWWLTEKKTKISLRF